jgi:hypothetical protein
MQVAMVMLELDVEAALRARPETSWMQAGEPVDQPEGRVTAAAEEAVEDADDEATAAGKDGL